MAELDDKYRGRIVCMGDFNSLADVDNDGMGLIVLVLTGASD